MIAGKLHRRVEAVADRLRLVRRRKAVAQAAILAALIGICGYFVARQVPAAILPMQIAFAIAAAALLIRAWQVGGRSVSDFSLAVGELEARYPELQARLLTAVEQAPDVITGQFNLLQLRLLTEVSEHARRQDWPELVPQMLLRRRQRQQIAALCGLLLVAVGLATLPRGSANAVLSAGGAGTASPAGPLANYTIDPGDAQVERGQNLLVLLRFQSEPPRDAALIWEPAGGPAERFDMTMSLDDPIFAGRLESVSVDGRYRLEFDGTVSPEYAVTVYDLPALVSSTITIASPSYTHREPQVLESATAVTLVEGSEILLECVLNKPVATAELRDEKFGVVIPLVSSKDDPRKVAAVWKPDASRRFQLLLKDADGRGNRDPEEFTIDVLPNRRPDLKIVFPGQDQRVSPLQELAVEARAADDFGIVSAGLVIDTPDGEQYAVPLSKDLGGGEAHPLEHVLAMEDLHVMPGEVLSYAFFAEDIGPDGQRRRTLGDLFFLEIRPFEESFREMEGAGGQSGMQSQSGSQNQQLDQLIEVQKQIVSATWNLQRRDPDLSHPDERAIVETLIESQQQAREQFAKAAEALEGSAPADRIAKVFEAMQESIDELTAVRNETTGQAEHLEEALRGARKAFQGLIALKPTDHRIVKGGQSGGGAGGGGSMSQQQLDQLELSEDANRYEAEKSAKNPAETSAQREQLAVLNRLKELAQRQQGVNQKLKELDAELRTAQTDEERAELERQLKQLRDEQQELLQDADELRNRLQKVADPSQTADTRRQLEQTRQELVDASESLKEGKLSQALSSGTRAERDLQKMQEEFRKKTSAQLAESLQELQQQARELTETEDKINEDLARLLDRNDKSLRKRQGREKVAESLQEQRERLEATLKSLRQTVQEAESSQPLAAKKLYEAARESQQQKTEEALEAAQQLVQHGFWPDATKAEQLARQGLQTLKEGIDEAAESILGDEVEALKQAKRELAELSAELQREMDAARGEGNSPSGGRQPPDSDTKPPGDASSESESQDSSKAKSSQPGNSPDGQPPNGEGKGEKPGNGDPSQENEKPSQGNQPGGKQAGEEGAGPGSPSETPSESPGSSPGGDSPSSAKTGSAGEGSSPGSGRPDLRSALRQRRRQGSEKPGPGTSQPGQSEGGQSGGPGGQGGPLTGGDYSNWTDRLRDVETLMNDPELQAEVSKIREQARSIRAEFKRHSKLPNWNLVEEDVRKPLVELQERLAEEIAKRESPDALVPTDRDPVPERYRELVRKYYERLGSGSK